MNGETALTVMEWSATDVVKTKEVDALGRETLFEYDERGNLTKERVRAQLPDADGNLALTEVETEFRYDPTYNKMTYKKDVEGRETVFEIDPSNGNLLSVRDAEGNLTRFVYGPNGDLEATLGPRPEQETRVSYDRNGNPETTTDSLGNVTTTEYDERSRLLSQTDTFGRSRTQEFDALDRVKRTVRTDGKGSSDEETIERTYYDGGEVLTERNGLGLLRTFELDGLNRVVRAEESTGSETLVATMSYDENGNAVEKMDRRGVASFLMYDERNRLTRVEVDGPFGPRKTVSTMGYDRVGNKLFETDVQGNRTEMEYDGLYRVVRRRLPTLHEEEFGYDRVGNKVSEEDANRNETRFEYDSLNRLIRRTDAVGNVTELAYDESGNQTLERDVTRGLRIETDHDALNRPIERRVIGSDPNGFTYGTTWVYDDSAHAVEETDPRGFRKTTDLDGFDRVHRVSQETGEEILETTSFYDGNGNPSRTSDGEGRETELEHDGWNRLREVRHPLGLETRFDYDGEGNRTKEVNRRGIETRFAYDDLGRLVKTELDEVLTNGGAILVTSEITYLDPERKRVDKDARGNETTYELDGQGRVVRIEDPFGEEQSFEYDGVNKRAEVDKRGERTELEYDGVNRVTKVTDALSQEVVTVYDDAARTVTETDERALVKTTAFDALGRLFSVTRSGVLLEEHAYDGNSNRVVSTDANGNPTRFEYDGANRLTGRTDAAGTRTRFTYDRVGNLLTEKDGRVTGKPFDVKNVYDDLNRLESTEDAERNLTTYEYDGEGNRTAVVEAKGSDYRTEYDYGELNELLQVRMPDGGVYRYDYDPARNRTRQMDGEGNAVSFTYDRLNRLDLMIQDPGGFNYTTDHDYDPNGNEIRLTDPKGQVIDFEYDELNRTKSKVYNLTPADLALYTRTHRIDYAHDENDNLVRIDETKSSGTDPPAVVSSLKTYDDLDRLETETDAWGRRLTYDYDLQGNRTLLIDPDSVRTEYGYDELNRLETLTFNDGQVVGYEYLPDGLKKKVMNPNGTVSSYAYDAADRMTEISHVGPTGLVSAYEYTYDPNGNRERQVETNGGRTETTDYTYDFVNRLKSVTYANQAVTYEYDLAGNRTREVTTGPDASDKTFHYDAINRLEQIRDMTTSAVVTSYQYDANGNTTSKIAGGFTTNFLFDIRDQLGEVRQGGSILGRYGYDYDGRRILKIGDDGRRQYTYDQLSVITEADLANATVSKYDYGMDQLVRLDNRNEGRSFLHIDGLRSTVSLTTSAGLSRQSIFYDAWGNERDRVGVSANRFTFTGHERDGETGLIYAKARFYDAEVGRFLSQDTYLGDIANPPSLHLFAYANANPIRFIDWSGLAGIEVTGHAPERLFLDPNTRAVYIDLPTVSESVQVRAYATRGDAVGATLDIQLARPVQRLGYPVSVGMRSAGVVAQGALAVGLATVPEPTFVTKAGAAYFGLRAVDEGQALIRELTTGEYTESYSQAGVRELYELGGASPKNASTYAGLTLTAVDTGVGVGVIRTLPAPEPAPNPLENLGRSGQAPKPVNVAEAPTGQAATPAPGQNGQQATSMTRDATGSPGAPDPVRNAIDRSDELALGGPSSPRSPLGSDLSYADPDPTIYGNNLTPDAPVVDHIRARALGGHPTDPKNLNLRAWSENARKGWHEGEYLKVRTELIEGGLTQEQAEWVLEDYLRWIETDIHATPVDPAVLNKLRSP